MLQEPLLTVIFVAGNKRERVQRSIGAMLTQDIADRIAIIVFDRANQPARDLPEFSKPNVMYEAVGKNTTLGQLQKRGVLEATTDIIAFIEEHVVVPPGWARESLRLHAAGYTGVTGFFLPGNPQYRWSRLTYNVTYGDYMLPAKIGETTEIPGDNATFVRSKILQFDDELELLLNSDTLLIRRLVARGEKLCRANLALKHWNEDKWHEGWTGLRYWSQMYICNSLTVEKWSIARRLFRLASLPLVPFVRVYKNYRRARTNGKNMKQFLADVPAVLLLHTGSTVGMAAALLFGYQDCEYRFADCETSARRAD